jgi:hypothetical protein
MIVATPSPMLRSQPTRRTPLEELGDAIDGARDDLARVDAMLSPRRDRDPHRGERGPT